MQDAPMIGPHGGFINNNLGLRATSTSLELPVMATTDKVHPELARQAKAAGVAIPADLDSIIANTKP